MPVRITVVTPSYNQARYLEETLRSVLAQRDQIHEFFVLDGGSTDGSAELIERYARAGGIDYWHSRKDKGQADAIHQGFSRASGDVLAWLNSDDLFLQGALAKVRQAFERHPRWDVLSGYHIRIDHASRIVSVHRIPGESARMARWGVHHVAQQTCFFKRSLYERVGGLKPDLHLVLDTELWYRMFDAGAVWGHLPRYLAAFRLHEQAKTSTWQRQYESEAAFLQQRYPRYFSRSLRHRGGLLFYRLMQVLSGRQARAMYDARRWRGKHWAQVFDAGESSNAPWSPTSANEAIA